MEKTTLYLPSELGRALRQASRRLRRSQADLVREALTRFLREQPRPRPTSLGMAADGRVPAAESEDWIHSRWQRTGP